MGEIGNFGSTQYTGYGLALLCNVGILGSQFGNKIAGSYVSPFCILGFRAAIQFLCLFCYLSAQGTEINIKDPSIFRLVLKRSSASLLTMAIFMTSNQFIPIGIAVTLFNVGPLITFFLQAFLLHKFQVKWIHFLLTLGCFIGIILIVQPEFFFTPIKQTSFIEYLYYGLVLFSAFSYCMNMLYAHKIGKQLPIKVTLFIGFFFHTVGNFILYFLTYDLMDRWTHLGNPSDNFIVVLFGFMCSLICGSLGQYSQVKAMSFNRPSMIMPFFYISVIGGMIIDLTIFNAQYDFFMIIGVFLTSLGLFCKVIIEKFESK